MRRFGCVMDRALWLPLVGQRVVVRTAGGELLSGALASADANFNLCLEDAALLGGDGARLQALGSRLLRGDAVAFLARGGPAMAANRYNAARR